LSKADAAEAARLLWEDHAAWIRQSRAEEMEQRALTVDGKTLKFHYTLFGDTPQDGRSLYISLHGGGNARPAVNDRQWRNQQTLYELSEGVYLAPRAPTNTWNLWHEPHIDSMFDRLIANLVVFEDVNPNRVYVLGYSAGGDGVYQLAPRMADRWAAAAMMAGHPNETSPLGLRNIGFALHVGANDSAYNRNEVAREWELQLAELHEQDPEGYRHQVGIHEGKGHWMDREDAVAVPWMASFVRDLRPKRIVWRQDDVTQSRFYWLAVDDEYRQGGTLVRADLAGQTVDIHSDQLDAVTVLLDDQMLDLDWPVSIRVNGHERFSGRVDRTVQGLAQSLDERSDPTALFSARVSVER
jgi:poly(3-hydroxybutyrate) depolymerase